VLEIAKPPSVGALRRLLTKPTFGEVEMAIIGVSSRNDLTQETLHQLLNYNAETGVFTWKLRGRELFSTDRDFKKWNTRYAGAVAGKSVGSLYRQIMIRPHLYYAHRLAWLYRHGEWPYPEIDHINGDRHDNRIDNLRVVDSQKNKANTRRHKDNEAGYKGVRLDKRRGYYVARLYVDGKERHLGSYPTAEEASRAYEAEAQKMHGEFARFSDLA
jgi:hypothetical protein